MAVEVAGHRFEVRHGRFGLGDAVLYDGLAVAQRRPFAERIVPFWVMETGREIRYEVEVSSQIPGRIAAIRRNGREVFKGAPPVAGDASPGHTGRYLGLPYDWRRPTWDRIRSRLWNPDDVRIWVPKAFGWGYDLNFHALGRRIGLIRSPDSQDR